jgi:DNA-binding LacI/PurR family transcriptional regulator
MPQTIEKSAKLSDVARAAGVSQGTVSNVFNRPNLVREEVREHVRQVARRLGYKGPDPKGRLLRAGKVNAIGIATAEPLTYFFNDPYARAVMEGIAETADAAGAGISLVSAANDEALAWNIQSALVDGFVLFCIEGGERLVRLTRERQLPFIALGLGTENNSVAAIGVDSLAGGRLAAEHLVGLGHRKFAVVALSVRPGHSASGPITLADVDVAIYGGSRDRVHGYFDVLSRHGIDTSSVPIFETQNDEPTVHAALEFLFGGADRPTALLVQSDRAALIAIDWLHAHGFDVPGDVSVIGFDGIAEAAASSPPLTTIAQPLQEIGRQAVKAILGGTPHGRQTLPVELVVRGSTAPPRR